MRPLDHRSWLCENLCERDDERERVEQGSRCRLRANAMASTPASAKQPSLASPMPPSPLSLAAHELLASQRAVLADLSSASAAVLRNETNKKQDEASTLLKKLRASEKREAAAVAEAAELRSELEKAAAANKRIAWESRKKEQATAAAASSAASAAVDSERRLRVEIKDLQWRLNEREGELSAARSLIKSMKAKRQQEVVQEQQAAFLSQREAGGVEKAVAETPLPASKAAAAAAAATKRGAKVVMEPWRPSPSPTEERALASMQDEFVAKMLLS